MERLHRHTNRDIKFQFRAKAVFETWRKSEITLDSTIHVLNFFQGLLFFCLVDELCVVALS